MIVKVGSVLGYILKVPDDVQSVTIKTVVLTVV